MFGQLLDNVRKVGQLFAIAAVLIHCAVWVHNGDHTHTIQLDFYQIFTNNLALVIGAVVCQLTCEHRNVILLVSMFVHCAVAGAASHVLD